MDNTTPPNRKRTQRDYTLGFKLSVVEQVEQGELTYKQAQTKYGIQGRSTVLIWLRKHGKLDWPMGTQAMNKSPETPAQKIKRLEKELDDAQKHNLLLSEMMDILKQQYGIDLRKKYLSKGHKGSRPKAK